MKSSSEREAPRSGGASSVLSVVDLGVPYTSSLYWLVRTGVTPVTVSLWGV